MNYELGKKAAGFTLIELMVAMVAFSIISIAFINLFISAISQQRRILNLNNLLNNVSYSLEYMDRAIRLAQKDMAGACVANVKYNYSAPFPYTYVRFLTYQTPAVCLEFSRQGDRLMVRRSSDQTAVNLGAYEPLTPTDLLVKDVKFNVINDGQAGQKQPRVTINLIMETKELTPQTLNLQTTICQRNPNFTQ
jgi:prepilin-type N-terminal cleavage/methylation domain-containing protein